MGYARFFWKTRQDQGCTVNLCPSCGHAGTSWGGAGNAGLQIEGIDVTYDEIERRHLKTPSTSDCRRWGSGTCGSCKLRFWHDFIGDWASYAPAHRLKPQFMKGPSQLAEPTCERCGCTEFAPCAGGCAWKRLDKRTNRGLCTACA